jgi:hypothetical protein
MQRFETKLKKTGRLLALCSNMDPGSSMDCIDGSKVNESRHHIHCISRSFIFVRMVRCVFKQIEEEEEAKKVAQISRSSQTDRSHTDAFFLQQNSTGLNLISR